MPCTPVTRSNAARSSTLAKPTSDERILAHDELGVQRRRAADGRQRRQRVERHGHAVADAADVDEHVVDALFDERAAQHARSSPHVKRRRVVARERVADGDGERVGGVELGRAPEAAQRPHHRLHLVLGRLPVAGDRALDRRRRVLVHRQIARAAPCASATPRLWPSCSAERALTPWNTPSTATTSGASSSNHLGEPVRDLRQPRRQLAGALGLDDAALDVTHRALPYRRRRARSTPYPK